jgi:hypothetical protein
MIGMDPQAIPMLVAQACAFDTALIVAIWAFRRRRETQGLGDRGAGPLSSRP